MPDSRHIDLLPKKTYYKANLHCHTTLSDGCYTPEEIKANYMRRGYSIVAYTDHDFLFPHTDLTDDAFLALTGYEMQVLDSREQLMRCKRDVAHLNFIAREPLNNVLVFGETTLPYEGDPAFTPDNRFTGSLDKPRTLTPEGLSEIIAEAKKEGFLVAFNHPTWSYSDRRHFCGLKGLSYMEIYNTCCEFDGHDTYCPDIYDEFLRDGQRISCIAADDNHNRGLSGLPKDIDSFGGWTMIAADRLDYPSVIRAIEQGDLYASRGPVIRALSVEGHLVHIETSPAARITLSCGCRRDDSVRAAVDALLTSADFELQGIEDYIRFTVLDDSGRTADTRAYWPEEFSGRDVPFR